MDAYDNLKNAIVQQSAEDYAAAFMGNKVDGKEPQDMMNECEKFFHSEWYRTLTNEAIDGNWLARNVKICELEKAAKSYEEILCVCNNVKLCATVSFPKEQDKEKPKAMTYIFPPKFADAIMDTLRIQQEIIKAELRKLKAENEEVE